MSKETPPLFGKKKLLEGQIDEFLDKVAEGAIYFQRGITSFIEEEQITKTCEEKLSQIIALKEKCKELRRSIINVLYSEMLIPDFRGDVLSLLTDVFSLLDNMGKNFQDLIIEQGQTLQTAEQITQSEAKLGEKQFLELVKVVVKCVDTVIIAARDFFRNPKALRDHIYQVRVYEFEADQIAISLKKEIFSVNLKFSTKINFRDRVDAIDAIADKAEDVADKLAIYAIQRTL